MNKIVFLTAFVAFGVLPAAADQMLPPAGRQPATIMLGTGGHVDAGRRAWVGEAMERFLSSEGDMAAQPGLHR